MVQRVTRCETRQGMEITTIISSYIRALVDEQRITDTTKIDTGYM